VPLRFLNRFFQIGLTGIFCTSGSEREFAVKGIWYADEEMQARQIVTLLRQVEVEIVKGRCLHSRM